jgi:TetR/AcrR family transcriptional regulator, cholesterol catabolism regulator
MPKGIPLTEEEQHRRRHEVFDAAIALFLQKGFKETTMQEIAYAAGMGKSTLYDYFKTKDEILTSFIEDGIDDLLEQTQKIVVEEGSPADKLQDVLVGHMQYLIDRKDIYLKLSIEAQRLSAKSQQRIQEKRHEYQDFLCGLVEDAIQEGIFRPVNSLLVVRTILALLPVAAYTTRPTGTPEQMMNETLDIFYNGVNNKVKQFT